MRHALPFWCVLYGTLLVQVLWGGEFRKSLGLKLTLGVLCGLGMAGLLTYACLWLRAGVGPGALLAGEAVLLALCAAAYARRRSAPEEQHERGAAPVLPRPLLAALAGLGLIALGAAVYASVCKGLSLPLGYSDALSSWNYKARCLYLNAAHWEYYVSDNEVVAGADYPLLLPCLLARGYAYAGGVSQLTSALLGPLFSYLILALLFFACWRLKSLAQGLLAGLFWLGTPGPFHWGVSQYGDLPVGAYFLAALVVLAVSDERGGRERGLLFLAGLMAGFGAFVKFEGQMFLVILVLVRFAGATLARGARTAAAETGTFLAGSAPGLAAVLSLRAVSDSTGYFAQNSGLQEMLAKLFDLSRLGEVAAYSWRTFTEAPSEAYGGLLITAAVLALLSRPAWKTRAQSFPTLAPLFCVLLALAGYAAIFLMTPIDMGEHLRTTAYRFL